MLCCVRSVNFTIFLRAIHGLLFMVLSLPVNSCQELSKLVEACTPRGRPDGRGLARGQASSTTEN